METSHESKIIHLTAHREALRGRIIARLSGVSVSMINNWRNDGLLSSGKIDARSSELRLYSWTDYMKIRLARKLHTEGVGWLEIRRSINYLEANEPEWYRVTLHGFSGRALIERAGDIRTVGSPSQAVFQPIVKNALFVLQEEGPLGQLKQFEDVIDMNPDILAANPVIRGTMLEAAFISSLVRRGVHTSSLIRSYRLSDRQITTTMQFMQAVA